MWSNLAKKAKGQLELNTVMEVKENKKGFCKYIDSLKKGREMSPLFSGAGDLVTRDVEYVFFASASTGNIY